MWLRRLIFLALLLTVVRGDGEEEDIYEGDEDEVVERAFLVAQKKILESEISDGTNVTVVLTIHNAGTRAASKIRVEEVELPEKVDTLSADVVPDPIDLLDAGSSLTYTTILRPQTIGQLVIQPSRLTYAPAVGSIEEQVAYSTPAFLTVLTTNEYLGTKILKLGSYMTLGMLHTKSDWIRFGILAGLMLTMFTMTYLWKLLSEARRERLRKRATEYIEKSK